VNRSSRMPLYAQLEVVLRSQISDGALRPGDLLPSEAVLGEQYGISRITVRAALQHLEQDGLLERQAGRGTFVKASQVEPWSCLTSFTEQMLRAGRTPTTRLLKLKTLVDDSELAPVFRLVPGEPLVFIERLRLVDGQPAALMRAYIPQRFVPGITRKHFGTAGREQSILYLLERKFGLVIAEGEETTAPVCLTQPEAGLLGLGSGSPVVYKACLVHNSQGEPLLLERAYWSTPQTEPVRRLSVFGGV
jgi:GntR family transcriptional regulator